MTTRLLIYLFSGAFVITWVAPPEGLSRYALIIALIIVGAYVDAWTRGRGKAQPDRSNVVSLLGYRKNHRHGASGQARDRRSMSPVFSSQVQSEADELTELLRGEGLRPVLVTAQTSERPHRVRFEVRLPFHEVERAQALIKWFRLKAGKHPN